MAASSSAVAPWAAAARSAQAYSRSLVKSASFMASVSLELAVSGMHSWGTTPYFSMRAAAESHQPPSLAGSWSHITTSRSSAGRPARRTISERNRLLFSSLSQNCR